MVKIQSNFVAYKSDAAPFFFFLDVIPIDLSLYEFPHHVDLLQNIQLNPIMPLPIRVDRVANGALSTLIRPRNLISFSIGKDYTAIINPDQFIKYGLEKLLNFSEIRISEQFVKSLSVENVRKWWNVTRSVYGRLRSLEDDFTAFLHAYLHIVLSAKINNEDLTKAAIKYCELIKEVCNKRIKEKYILVELKGKEKLVEMYKMKEGKVQQKGFRTSKEKLLYPSFIDIEVIDMNKCDYSRIFERDEKITKKYSKDLAYIPLLIYDDLLECMLQNLNTLKNFEGQILDPTFLLEKKIVIMVENGKYSPDQLVEYTWLKNFDDIDINSIMAPIKPTFLN